MNGMNGKMKGIHMNRTYQKAIFYGLAFCILMSTAVLAQQEDSSLRDEIETLKQGQEQIQREIRLMREVEALKKGQEDMKRELEEIKKLVKERPAAAPRAAAGPNVKDKVFDLGTNPIKGDKSAKLTLIEFTDYQCPFCSRHVKNTHPKIEEEYIKTGKLRYSMLDMPLENIHKLAFKAAQASHCAQDQGKFWEMHDRIFLNQRSLEPWSAHAEALGLDAAAFQSCLDSEKHAKAVRKDMAEARKAGATGTPSFVLASTDPNNPGKVKGISFIRGAKSFDAFKTEIEGALKATGK